MRKGYRKPLMERLMGLVEKQASGCWLFVGVKDKDGYGALKNRGYRDFKAHRVAYELFVGSVPSGLDVAHHCDVRNCVNPDHLYAATRQQNLADRTARKREVRGESAPWSKIDEAAVREIRSHSGRLDELARKHRISRAQAYRIRSGECWAHVA